MGLAAQIQEALQAKAYEEQINAQPAPRARPSGNNWATDPRLSQLATRSNTVPQSTTPDEQVGFRHPQDSHSSFFTSTVTGATAILTEDITYATIAAAVGQRLDSLYPTAVRDAVDFAFKVGKRISDSATSYKHQDQHSKRWHELHDKTDFKPPKSDYRTPLIAKKAIRQVFQKWHRPTHAKGKRRRAQKRLRR